MKGKLIKIGDGYSLSIPSESTNNFIASTDGMYVEHKLSIKNCQAIEKDYDLDELASEFAYNQSPEDSQESFAKFAFKDGFQKAMQLMEGKKFSIDDILVAMICMQGQEVFYEKTFEETLEARKLYIENYIKHLQTKEWEVEIEMQSIPADRAPNGWDVSPKLDQDGCLILKKI